MGGLTIELELVSDPLEPIISNTYTSPGVSEDDQTASTPYRAATSTIALLQEANISRDWTISEVQVRCDVVTLDNNFNEEYVKYLLSGKSLAINYNTYVSQMQTVVNAVNSVHITRSLSRLKSIFISHVGNIADKENYAFVHKEFNNFDHPMLRAADSSYDPDFEMEWQVQIGSRLYPEYSVRSNSESYFQFFQCLGILSSSFHSIDINGPDYHQLKFIIGLDLEKVLGAGFTGINTKAGYYADHQ